MDCLQEFGQFKQVLNCNGLKQNVSLMCPWFPLHRIVGSQWFQTYVKKNKPLQNPIIQGILHQEPLYSSLR